MPELSAFLITWATHNSRVSERMVHYKVKRGDPVWMSAESEILVTKAIAEIIEQDQLRVLAYNICGDHVHMVLFCEEEKVSSIVRKLKSQSARIHNLKMGISISQKNTEEKKATGLAPLSPNIGNNSGIISNSRVETNKSGASPTAWKNDNKNEVRGKTQNSLWTRKYQAKRIYDEQALQNAIEYVRYNRIKHNLPPNYPLHPIIKKMLCSYEEVFGK